MSIPSEIEVLINRINQELNQTEQAATNGILLIRPLMSLFPDNGLLIQFFAYLNDVLLFIEVTQRRVQMNLEMLSATDVSAEEMQEVGEDLGTLLGRIIEARIAVIQIIERLERLQ